ncbi:MAG: phenylalanine--tRNA ligase subunit beta [Deltaproteobacteria bacterium]|nr:phenylalanine--tRNA ligase subunit beta [Deltaproteobacteria bacterium]
MKISLNWLKSYVPIQMDVNDLAEALTMTGLEVEAVYDRYDYLKNVVVGRVVSISAHPNSTKLQCCVVDSGKARIPVVCGAPNVHVNCLSALALPGTQLPDGTIIEASAIRGADSEGMLCSEAELGLGPDRSGIMLLPEDLSVGQSLASALDLSDMVLEIGLTPNRSDCLSFIGIAREVAAIQKTALSYPEINLPEGRGAIRQMTSVSILAPDHCPRYAARILTGAAVGPSPYWLQDRLISVGIRPINNVVDITNFVMMETGQPLHAFDFERLAGHRIVVRTAVSGEPFTTLDHKSRTLTADMLMICDGEKPVAIAGVMGGYNSEIEPATQSILIESACFDPTSIRKTSKYFGLNTDASHRFERGVDPEGTVFALDRAAALMVEICGGVLIEGVIDERPVVLEQKPIVLSAESTNRLLGTQIDSAAMDSMLQSIGFTVEPLNPDQLKVIPPSFRVDVSRPVDLVEEIARLSGYDRIPTTFPVISEGSARSFPSQRPREQILRLMTGLGFSETITYSFVHPQSCKYLRLESGDPRMRILRVLNPLSEDQGIMRTSLIPGVLETVNRNISRQSRNLKLFEIGNVFISNGQDVLPDEIEMLSGLWTGARQEASWHTPDTACDFYDLKGVVEALLSALHIHDIRFSRNAALSCPYLKPGYAAGILCGRRVVGHIGQVHSETLGFFNIKQPVYVFEIDIQKLFASVPDVHQTTAIPRFPAVARDITLILSKTLESRSIIEMVEEMHNPLVERIMLFDVFEGGHLPLDKKSLSFRLTYRSAAETLEDEAVNALHKNISDKLIQEFDAALP